MTTTDPKHTTEGPYKVEKDDRGYAVRGLIKTPGSWASEQLAEYEAAQCNAVHAAALRSLSQGSGLDLTQFDGITQGEWVAIQREFGNPKHEGGPIIRGWDVFAGDVPVSIGTIANETEANQRAIAAVPKMLAEVRRLLAECGRKDEALSRIDAITTSGIGEPPHDRQKRMHNGELGCDGINHFDHLDEIQGIAREARKEQP